MRTCILLAVTAVASAAAQPRKTVETHIGTLYRFNGDTIWQERDSTVMRNVYRGDTVFQERTVPGKPRSAVAYLILGDSARVLWSTDSTGARVNGSPRLLPAMIANSPRDMLAMQMRGPQGAWRVPLTTTAPVSYCIDGARTILQHADTARYLRKSADRVDTTVYVFVGDTTIKRVSPNPATLGYAMYLTVFGEMEMSLVRKSLASRQGPAAAGIPGRSSDTCNR